MGWRQKIGLLRRFWDDLPIDGSGFMGPADPDARRLIAIVTRRRLRMVPRAIQPLVVAVARVLWCVKAVSAVRAVARKYGFGTTESLRHIAMLVCWVCVQRTRLRGG